MSDIPTPLADNWQVGDEDQHITVEAIFDYVPKNYGWFWRNYYFDAHFDAIQAITIPAVWFATIILIIGGPWQLVYYAFNTGDMNYSDETML